MVEQLSVNLSEVLGWANEFSRSAEYGFINDTSGEIIYMVPNGISHFILLLIQRKLGVSKMVRVIDDIADIEEETSLLDSAEVADISIKFSAPELREILMKNESTGMFLNVSQTSVPDRLAILYSKIDGIEEMDEIEDLLDRVEIIVRDYLKEHLGLGLADCDEATIKANAPSFIYIGKLCHYSVFERLNEIVMERINIVISYFNSVEYNEIKSALNTKRKMRVFEHILSKYDKSEVLQITKDTPALVKFRREMKLASEVITATDFETRSIRQKFFQLQEMYEWVLSTGCKVVAFDIDIHDLSVDNTMYAALAMLQCNIGLKVLPYRTAVYSNMLESIANMKFSDGFTRIKTVLEMYKRDTIRILSDYCGRKAIAVSKGCTLDLEFSGINVLSLKDYIRRDEATGELVNILDCHVMEDPAVSLLSSKNFEKLKSAGFEPIPMSAMTVLESLYKQVFTRPEDIQELSIAHNGKQMTYGPYATRDFENFIYICCRIIDQLANKFTTVSTLKDTICFVLRDVKGESSNASYIGSFNMNPVMTCDVVVLAEGGILIEDVKYSGTVLDPNWIDDLTDITFGDETVEDADRKSFIDQMHNVFEQNGRPIPTATLEDSRFSPKQGKELLMCMLHEACSTTSVDVFQDIYKMVQEPAYAIENDLRCISDLFITPLLLGLVIPRNDKAYQYLTPHILKYTESYGYRLLKSKDSPVNIFGGVNVNDSFNMWLYTELFQKHEKSAAEMESE